MKKLLEIYNFWCKIPDKIRFLIIGAINAGISYVIFAVAVYLIGEQYYQVCAALQWILSSFISLRISTLLYDVACKLSFECTDIGGFCKIHRHKCVFGAIFGNLHSFCCNICFV